MALFKNRIKQLRLNLGLSQKEFGEKIGYSESTISMYESGNREPKKAEDYVKIADFFDVSLDYLLGRTDDPQTVLLTNKDLPIPEEYSHLDIEIGADRKTMPDVITEDMVRHILKTLEAQGYQIEKKECTEIDIDYKPPTKED